MFFRGFTSFIILSKPSAFKHTISIIFVFFLVFGFSLISSFFVWLYNYLIRSGIEGSVEIEGLVEIEALAEGFKGFAIGFAVDLIGFARLLDFESFESPIDSII
jgi:hypothetical protein